MRDCIHWNLSLIVTVATSTFERLDLDCGVTLAPVEVAYETYGTLNADKSNAILVLHAFSGDAHAAGEGGWWSSMIGSGKGFDTDQHFVICSNILGGCRGTTGPSSINPETGEPWAMSFPTVTVADMVRLQKMLIDSLGIKKLLAVAGGSMGGMQALEWAVAYPENVGAALPIATTARHSAQQIAFNEVGRQAIMADPAWQAAFARGIREALAPGVDGWVDEVLALLGDWADVDVAAVSSSVTWWHSPDDRNCPYSAARRLVARLPDARLILRTGTGHLVADDGEGELLDELLARA